MFHIFSPPFLPFCSEFSKCQKLKLFPSRVDGCLQAHWEGQDFYSNEFFLCKNTWISFTASASTDPRLRLCGTQTHLFSVATKVYDAECFFVANPERNATATQKELLWWDGLQLETNSWPALRTLRELILHPPPWTQTYSLRMFSIGS